MNVEHFGGLVRTLMTEPIALLVGRWDAPNVSPLRTEGGKAIEFHQYDSTNNGQVPVFHIISKEPNQPYNHPKRLVDLVWRHGESGHRFLPWQIHHVTGMRLDAAARIFLTGDLRGCSVYVASRVPGGTEATTEETWVFHANSNEVGLGDLSQSVWKILRLAEVKSDPDEEKGRKREAIHLACVQDALRLLNQESEQCPLRITHCVRRREYRTGDIYHAFFLGGRIGSGWTFKHYTCLYDTETQEWEHSRLRSAQPWHGDDS